MIPGISLRALTAPPPFYSQQIQSGTPRPGATTEDYNRRLRELERQAQQHPASAQQSSADYRIGPEDLLNISVFEAPEMNRSVRVSAGGEVSLPLIGDVRAAGLTPRALESVIEELLRRSYMKSPHVSVFVQEMQSHDVSVFGAVKQPGVFQIRGAKTVVEMLSMAQGLAEDAGDTVLVTRGGAAPEATAENASAAQARPASLASTEEINLKSLLESGDPQFNVLVYPGDVVKVTRAGIVYVVGEVKKPGGFELKSNENVSVLQALALAEGLTRTSASAQARIIRTDEVTGKRTEIPINLGKVLDGKLPDPMLQPRDIVFVPNSSSRSALYRGLEAAISVGTGVVIYRR